MEQKKKALGRGLEQLFSSEVLDFDKTITLRQIHSLDIESQCQYLVSTDKGCATLMIDYASAGKDWTTHIAAWLPTKS